MTHVEVRWAVFGGLIERIGLPAVMVIRARIKTFAPTVLGVEQEAPGKPVRHAREQRIEVAVDVGQQQVDATEPRIGRHELVIGDQTGKLVSLAALVSE